MGDAQLASRKPLLFDSRHNLQLQTEHRRKDADSGLVNRQSTTEIHMRKLQSTLALRRLALCAIFSVCTSATTVMAEPPQQPSNMFIQAAPTDTEYELRVTWADFLDEDGYQLIANNDSTPGPIFVGTEQPSLGNGWELITNLPANTTEFVHTTIYSWTYAICGLKKLEISCAGFSTHASPKSPPASASVDSLQVSLIAADRVRVQWTQSSNTMYSRAEVKQGSNILFTQENDADQSITFLGLQPNATHTIEVCVRNEVQTAASETCRSTTARTLPLIPLAPSSVGVNQSDPSPRQRTVSFSHNNRSNNAVTSIAVRLIKDNEVVKDHYVYPDSFGERDYQHTFTDLQPFTGYEAWVIPYNQSGVGTSAGIGFTTPTEVNLSVQPLSGDSVMLRWLAPAIGQYVIERKNGTTWTEIYTTRLLHPGEPRVILERMDGSKEVRVTWKLAYLNTQSAPIVATPLSLGAPELVSVRSRSIFFGNPLRFGTRYTITFRTTVAGSAEYILQRKTTANWVTVASTRTSLFPSPTFADNTLYTLRHETTGLLTQYRICKGQLRSSRGLLCGPSHHWASEGLPRLGWLRR